MVNEPALRTADSVSCDWSFALFWQPVPPSSPDVSWFRWRCGFIFVRFVPTGRQAALTRFDRFPISAFRGVFRSERAVRTETHQNVGLAFTSLLHTFRHMEPAFKTIEVDCDSCNGTGRQPKEWDFLTRAVVAFGQCTSCLGRGRVRINPPVHLPWNRKRIYVHSR